MNPLRRLLVLLGFNAAAGSALRASATTKLVLDVTPDAPVSFGYKVNWFAINTADPISVARVLAARDVRLANWETGLGVVFAEPKWSRTGDFVFISPPVDGWVFLVGKGLSYPDQSDKPERRKIAQRFDRIFSALMTKYPDVQFFGSHRVVSFCAWARARNGRVERIFAYADGEVYANVGAQTAEERQLKFINLTGLSLIDATNAMFEDARQQEDEEKHLTTTGLSRKAARQQLLDKQRPPLPNEEDPLDVAAAWSVNPMQLEERQLSRGVGYVARLPARFY